MCPPRPVPRRRLQAQEEGWLAGHAQCTTTQDWAQLHMETRVACKHAGCGVSSCDGVGGGEALTPPIVADLCFADHLMLRHAFSRFSNFPLLFLCSRGSETQQACSGEWLSCICRCPLNWLAHSSAKAGAQQWRAANALPKPPQWLFDVYCHPLTSLELRTAYRRACV